MSITNNNNNNALLNSKSIFDEWIKDLIKNLKMKIEELP